MNYSLKVVSLADQYCKSASVKRPASIAGCMGQCEGVRWMYGRWSDCSLTCGGGIQYRTAVCVDSEAKTLDDGKCFAIASETTQKCGKEDCPKWRTGDWTEVTNIPYKCIQIFLFKPLIMLNFIYELLHLQFTV